MEAMLRTQHPVAMLSHPTSCELSPPLPPYNSPKYLCKASTIRWDAFPSPYGFDA